MEIYKKLGKLNSFYNRVREIKKHRESSDIKVVNYRQEFKKTFRDLNMEWITEFFEVEEVDRIALDNPDKYILGQGGFIFVAIKNEKPLGVCALLKRQDAQYPFELAKMAVSKEAQGKGIGFLLGKTVIEKAQALGAEKLYLESNTVLSPAIHLYQKLGFQKVSGLKTPYKRCNIQMELLLK